MQLECNSFRCPGFENGDDAWRGGGGGASSYTAAPPVIGIDDVSIILICPEDECVVHFSPCIS
jgi:hypothetical protein